jgi:Domain of unknown function (DUF6429)
VPGLAVRGGRGPAATWSLVLRVLGLQETDRAWKSFDWHAVVERLHEKGYITSPISKAKSVIFTEEGLKESERLFTKLFTQKPRLHVP